MKKHVSTIASLAFLGIISLGFVFFFFYNAVTGKPFVPFTFMLFLSALFISVFELIKEVREMQISSEIERNGRLAYGVVVDSHSPQVRGNVIAYMTSQNSIVVYKQLRETERRKYSAIGTVLKLKEYNGELTVLEEIDVKELPAAVYDKLSKIV